ncbi:UDP-glucose:glycoprotein glucosyltransferase [Olea europaea subsp. europaea]|uniref:UDP-glucose:glycoprotein glucosyltransferase n=1 Tax=Olea europaea subsp. europaea TaxID=158383 RepID=A0A8S0RB55_OLEEU|nr:UDP-glucose:glycoprotein glucosyltransferase [Olea europaea subsp. europaea]
MRTPFRSRFCLLILVLLCICSCSHSVSAENRRPKNVQVVLKAKWFGTPVLLEAGELLSEEWKDHFWDFIESWHHSMNENTDSNTAKDCLRKIAKYGKSLLSNTLASVFEFSLFGLHLRD